jgi:methionyl-tRNA formyltransferase
MNDPRIVFLGTPDFAVGVLKTLVENQFNIVGIITAPDKPSGRGRKINQSAVKKYALDHKLPILQPTNLKSVEFLKELKDLKPDLQIVVAFRMLPKTVWQLPKLGTFNLHASLLPDYRGAAPINWAIINGETKTGVTTFFLDEKIDTGEIILQEEVEISETDTAGDLHDKLMDFGSELVVSTVRLIQQGKIKTTKQPKSEKQSSGQTLKMAPKIFKETCKINWLHNIDDIYNKIRGLSPFPTSWSFIDNINETLEVKIYKARKEIIHNQHEIGSLHISKKEIKVSVKDGFIILDELQLPGKRKMNSADLLNGFSFHQNAKML